jgi:uncharacterized integral membrane protein
VLSNCAVGAAYLTYLAVDPGWNDPAGIAALIVAITGLIAALTALSKVFQHDKVLNHSSDQSEKAAVSKPVDRER